MAALSLLERVSAQYPLIQAPMAGVSTPELAAAVSNAGGLGSIAVGAENATAARAMIMATRALTGHAFNVNLFAHTEPIANEALEANWLAALAPLFESFGARAPSALRTIYKSFDQDDDMLAMLLQQAPAVVSFHFGLPTDERIAALKQAGCLLLASATNMAEAAAAKRAGIDAVVAQGYEAGGHRGVFDPAAADDQLGTFALTRLLAVNSGLPVIAAGGIMDGQGVRAALNLGAVAAQLGTAFIDSPESSADAAFRRALHDPAARTIMTRAISGRPARCLANAFTQWGSGTSAAPPDYPRAYDAGKALNAAAKAGGEHGYGAQWAGQGAPLVRALPAADLVFTLCKEAGLI